MAIEDTIYLPYLPVNSKAMLNRIHEILDQNKTNVIDALPKNEQRKVRKVIFLLLGQLETHTYNRLKEYEDLVKTEVK